MQFHAIQKGFAISLTDVSLSGNLRDDLIEAVNEGMDRDAVPVFRCDRYDPALRRELGRVNVLDGCFA